jgi:hypothetical protein
MTYSKDNLRQIFQQPFNQQEWQTMLRSYFHATELKAAPERIEGTADDEQGYYLGAIDTTDSYRIGLFYYQIQHGNVARKRVGLRNLVKSFVNPNWGEFDAALVVFDSGSVWRLSFVCDIKGENTAAKRYTYVFGETDNYYNTPVGRFDALQRNGISFENIKDAFSVEALTKQFYQDLFEWYQWAVKPETGITFPNNTSIEDDDREDIDIKIIRLITRLMFVWFIKQKGLVPERIFDTGFLSTILKDFEAQSATNGAFYNAILQNLFFATLNRAIIDEDGNQRKFAKASKRDIKTLYRYAELFCISEEEVINLFAEVPFLNGGLFECLDKTRYIDGVEVAYNFDGFSRNNLKFADGRYKHRAVVPNVLFFKPEKGLISILSQYNFTIEENSPEEQQVALDPELLGKVFENLLGAYNPETKETARNQSGSFYTPREIVNYMVDESLIAYLGDTPLVRSLFSPDFVADELQWSEYQMIAGKLKSVKIFDPACGSGAFPMGLLNRIVDLLQKIETDTTTYNLKLRIIENCLYGSDIQSIAAQITKLRFFISLICDCEKNPSKPNFGIPTLPNLETKFVTANSLIGRKNKGKEVQGNLFVDSQINEIKQQLRSCRHQHFNASSTAKKVRLRKQDEELRGKLTELLSEGFESQLGAEQLAAWNPYDQNAVSPFFDAEWMFGLTDGFDIVIGNPPYIQLQNNGGELARLYQDNNYKTFARTGDIYCLFYERGWQLLKDGGHLCYITSNKWMRAGYGEKTREFLANRTNPMLLIDFAGVKIFESATVDTNILLFSKSVNRHNTICAVTNKENKDSIKNLSDFVQQQHTVCEFTTSDSWVILSPIEQSIKRKIEAVGTPLKDWDINIYRGVLTGYNEAFIINSNKRDEILSNCQSEDERQRTAELIRPILRGRDIKRYGYSWADLWLIYIPWHFPYQFDESLQGASEKAEIAFKELYPAVYSHMLQYKEPLSQRNKAETGIRYEWYAMQRWGAKYWEDFSRPKIVWGNLNLRASFALVDNDSFINAPSPMIVPASKYLLGMLNSKIADYFIRKLGVTRNGGYFEYKPMFVEQLPIPVSSEYKHLIEEYVTSANEEQIDRIAYKIYGLNQEEIDYVESKEG